MISKHIQYLLFQNIREDLISRGNGSIFTNLKTDISGIVSIYGTKRKQDKSWSKREGVYMFTTSIYNDFKVDKDFTYISDYNDEHVD